MTQLLEGYISKADSGATLEPQDPTLEKRISYYFDIIEEHSVSLQSQITDNWIENNSVVSDHIANQPLTVTLRGFIGEIVYIPSTSDGEGGWLDPTKYNYPTAIAGKLAPLIFFFPPVSNLTQIAKNTITYVESSFNRYKKIIDRFKKNGLPDPAKLKIVFKNLNSLRNSKTALTVNTPYFKFEDMYIQSLVLRQGNQNYISDIEITLKQIYFSEAQTTTVNKENRENCNFIQREEVENHGITQGKDLGALGSGGNSDNGNGLFKLWIEYNKYL